MARNGGRQSHGWARVVFALWAVLAALIAQGAAQDFLVGTGVADVTGPAGQINMMGYANPSQVTRGLQTRLFSRAFIFVDTVTGDRVVYVNTDLAFITQMAKIYIIRALQERYGNLYNNRNVALAATHTHGGPGGFSGYVLLQITSYGFVEDNFWAIVDGIVASIVAAHDNIRPVNAFGNIGELLDTNINRSPSAYENNPAEERARYAYNVDKDMMLLKLVGLDGTDVGLINWFPVHATSMNNSNLLITSDNKGYAAYLMEREFNGGPGSFPGKGPFLAAFSTSNQGDVSPNTKGAFCLEGPNVDQPCDYYTSTCPNDRGLNLVRICHGQGPAGKNDRENNRIIGDNQYRKARELYNTATLRMGGRVLYRQTFVNMTGLAVTVNGNTYITCKPAMGYSFASGATDGPGFFNFKQGDTNPEHPFWDRIRDFLLPPSEEQRVCQLPKPILLATGEALRPHAWQPDIVDLQLLVLGDVVIIMAPGEFSTMAGRRMRDRIRSILTDGGVISPNAIVAISGLANTYTSYIVTPEEYMVQRYEGASTIYGPHTLSAYLQEFSKLAQAIVNNQTVPEGPAPPDFYDILLSQAPVPKEDIQPSGNAFGAVKRDVAPQYTIGQTVSVLFYGANPRNNLMTGGTFLEVEYNQNGNWTVVRRDSDYDTELRWVPLHDDGAEQFVSDVEIVWLTDNLAQLERERVCLIGTWCMLGWDGESPIAGEYRIRYYGYRRDAFERTYPFTGLSGVFRLL